MPGVRLEHAALWVRDLEPMKEFYATYFQAVPNDKYTNPNTGFSSYFLSFSQGARLELMSMPSVTATDRGPGGDRLGPAHLAFSVGSRLEVDALTERLRLDGYAIVGEPRVTGDGYYESVVLDPEGNRVEITA